MTKEEDELRENLINEIPGAQQRFRWIKDREEKFEAGKGRTSPTLLQLYPQVKVCYIHQCYLASAVMASIAIESHLKINLYGLPVADMKPRFWEVINKAQSDGHITKDLAHRLQRLRETIRNYIVHPRSMFGVQFLGLRQTGPGSYGAPNGLSMKSFKEAAEEAIECLLVLNKEYPFKIKV